MRFVLILGLLGASCSFYTPTVADCTLACGANDACPQGLSCRGGLCRGASAQADCECAVGKSRACGSSVGVCVPGTQACLPGGTWGECAGETKPGEELCDGVDNDCDGLIDVGPAQVIIENNNGPYLAHWRLHGHDAGFTLVATLELPDGGGDVRALRYDRHFAPRGQSESIVAGEWRRADSINVGQTIYVTYWRDPDLDLSRVRPDGTVERVATILDAGYDGRINVGAGARGVISNYLSLEGTARVATWALDGGATAVRDLALGDGGVITWVGSSTDGTFSILEADAEDGGYVELVQDNVAPDPVNLEAPFWKSQRFITRPTGELVHFDIIPVVMGMDDTRVVYWRDYAQQTTGRYFDVEVAGRWHDSDFTLSDKGDVVAVYGNETTQRLVVARIEGITSNELQLTRRQLDDVVVPLTNSSGNFLVAHVPGDPMFGVAWSTRNKVYARRFCAP